MTIFSRFIKDEAGATAIEYSLIAALMATAVIAGMNALTPNLMSSFSTIAGQLTVTTK